MNAGQERQKEKKRKKEKIKFPRCMKIYHNTVRYIQDSSPTASFSTASTIYKSNAVDRVSLETHKCDSNINKAEHGYNIGMHAVNNNKHPVNNILRLNKVFL